MGSAIRDALIVRPVSPRSTGLEHGTVVHAVNTDSMGHSLEWRRSPRSSHGFEHHLPNSSSAVVVEKADGSPRHRSDSNSPRNRSGSALIVYEQSASDPVPLVSVVDVPEPTVEVHVPTPYVPTPDPVPVVSLEALQAKPKVSGLTTFSGLSSGPPPRSRGSRGAVASPRNASPRNTSPHHEDTPGQQAPLVIAGVPQELPAEPEQSEPEPEGEELAQELAASAEAAVEGDSLRDSTILVEHHEQQNKQYEAANPQAPLRNPEKNVKVKLHMPDSSYSTVLIGPRCTAAEVCGTVAFRRGYQPLVLYTRARDESDGGVAQLRPGDTELLQILRDPNLDIEVRELLEPAEKATARKVGYQTTDTSHNEEM